MSEMGMTIEHVRVFGFEPAIRDMRNPRESWALSDSRFYDDSPFCHSTKYYTSEGGQGRSLSPEWNTRKMIVPEWPDLRPRRPQARLQAHRG